MNKANGGDGIPAELFQILKDDAVNVWCSICEQILNTQQWLTLESPLDSKGIKPVNPKGNQSWTFTGRTDAEAPLL